MTRRDFAANAACVREIENAFSLSSLFFVPQSLVGTNYECKNLTARASRICRSVLRAVSSGRFVGGLVGLIRSACSTGLTSWAHMTTEAVSDA